MQDPKPGYIYCITNQINGKRYVGETMYPDQRWFDHKRHSARDKGRVAGKPLYLSMRKHGVDNFTFEVVAAYGSAEEALTHEDWWINHLKARTHQHGYNLKAGGRGGANVSPETSAKMSAAKRGTKASDVAKARMSAAHKIVWHKKNFAKFQLIRQLHSEGALNKEIARQLGTSDAVICGLLKRMGLPSNVNLPGVRSKLAPSGDSHYHAGRIAELTPRVLEMRAFGCGYQEISDHLKCSFTTIEDIFTAAGMPSEHEFLQSQVSAVVELRDSGLSWEQIGDKLGFSTTTAGKLYRQVKEDNEHRHRSGEEHYDYISRKEFGPKVVELRSQGLSFKAIGNQLGFSYDTAKRMWQETTGEKVKRIQGQPRKKRGRKPKPPPPPPKIDKWETHKKMAIWLESIGMTHRDISVMFGCHRASVSRWLRESK